MHAGARLAVIGVANTLDLPERLLPRIASRLGSRQGPACARHTQTCMHADSELAAVLQSRACLSSCDAGQSRRWQLPIAGASACMRVDKMTCRCWLDTHEVPRRVTFQPYTRQQLIDIVTQRLKDADAVEAFDASAITFAARKARPHRLRFQCAAMPGSTLLPAFLLP